ncbi:MAG TPA: universal stress protein, partial [Actinoplanes sp.]|nr:universal stress protein [Actinoplanes sp.]
MPAKRIVVGYDGSQGANSALRWALVEAVGTRAEIELVFARARLDLGGERDNGPLPAAVAEIRAEFPHVPVISSVRPGSAVTVLCDRSLDADLLVVGGRSHGAFADVLLGSVAAAVAARAPCTVVVTSGLQPLAPAGHVLLGLAQSPGADLATAFAFSHAAARGLPLRAIRAWIPPPDGCIGSPDADPDGSAVAELAIIRRQLSAWRERYPWVPMDIAVVPGPPHRVLVEAARPAGLVVLGAHGHGHLHGQ